jgi:hypothetical protein
MIYFGYLNFLDGFKSLRAINDAHRDALHSDSDCGALVVLFTVEQSERLAEHLPNAKGLRITKVVWGEAL